MKFHFIIGGQKMENELTTLATVQLCYSSELYKIVDLCNKTLKEQNLIFGLALDDKDEEQAIFTIYRS
ncbi:Protein of unknown function [Virgibacillus pantothenticus]|nr:Protein of unknown function [Virgibacillus pantothenticus]